MPSNPCTTVYQAGRDMHAHHACSHLVQYAGPQQSPQLPEPVPVPKPSFRNPDSGPNSDGCHRLLPANSAQRRKKVRTRSYHPEHTTTKLHNHTTNTLHVPRFMLPLRGARASVTPKHPHSSQSTPPRGVHSCSRVAAARAARSGAPSYSIRFLLAAAAASPLSSAQWAASLRPLSRSMVRKSSEPGTKAFRTSSRNGMSQPSFKSGEMVMEPPRRPSVDAGKQDAAMATSVGGVGVKLVNPPSMAVLPRYCVNSRGAE